MKRLRSLLFGLALALLAAAPAHAQLTPLTWGNFKNLLICGDFGTCPWQLGTSFGASLTSTGVTNGAYTADQWFGASVSPVTGVNFGLAVSQSTTAGVPPGFQFGLQMGRALNFASTTQMCLAQILETANVIPLQGQNATLSFYAQAGPNFSGSALVANIISGTGTDQGAAILNLAQWTGQTTLSSVSIPFTSSNSTVTRYQPGTAGGPFTGLTAAIPSTATELAVEICYTPTGTAGAQDFVGLDGIQFEAGGTATTVERRSKMAELALAERYLAVFNEPSSAGGAVGYCESTGSSAGKCVLPLPVPMRLAPTWTGTTPGTFSINNAGTVSTITTGTNTTGTVSSCQFTNANTGQTAGNMSLVVGKGGSGVLTCNDQY